MAPNTQQPRPRAPAARYDQYRLPETFSLEELGDWVPKLGAVEEGDAIDDLAMAMESATLDLAQTMGRRSQHDTTAVVWQKTTRPPVPAGRRASHTAGMTQDWLPREGRVAAPWHGVDPRPYHNPRFIFHSSQVARPPAGTHVRRYYAEQYESRFPRPVTYRPGAPWRAFTYGAVGDLARCIVFDYDGDRHRLVGTADRAYLLPGALAAILLSAREVMALVVGAGTLLRPLGFRAPDALDVMSGGKLMQECSAAALMNSIDELRTEIANLLSFVRLAAEFVPGQAHRLAPMGWKNPVRPGASFAQTMVLWGVIDMPPVGFAFDASVPEHALPPLTWIAGRGVDYRWFWPYSDTNTPSASIAAFNPDSSPCHQGRPAPTYLEVLQERHRQADLNRRLELHSRQRQQERQEQEARERAPYKDLGQLVLLRTAAKKDFNTVYVAGSAPGRGIFQSWSRIDGPVARAQAITDKWIERFSHIREWPAPGITTFLGWSRPDGSPVPNEEIAAYVAKKTRGQKRKEKEELWDEDDEDDELSMDMGGGPARIPFTVPEEQEPSWDYLAEFPDLVGSRFGFEADLQPLCGDFPDHFEEWRRKPSSAIRLPPPSPARAADFNNEETLTRMEVDETQEMRGNEAIVGHTLHTDRDEARAGWEMNVRAGEASGSVNRVHHSDARQSMRSARAQPYNRQGRPDGRRPLERRISPTRRSHLPVDRRLPFPPPPRARDQRTGWDVGYGLPSATHSPGAANIGGQPRACVITATGAPASSQPSTADNLRWQGQEAHVAVVAGGPRRVHTTMLPYIPQFPIGRAVASSSPQAVLRLAWQSSAGPVDNVPFVDGIAMLLDGAAAGTELAETVARFPSVQCNLSAIRLGVPALLMRRYCQLVNPTMTVREFLLWMLQHGTPFGLAHTAPPAQPEVGLPILFQPMVPTFAEWRARVQAMLREKPCSAAFALAGGISWRIALWAGGPEYAARVAAGPSVQARHHGEEFGWRRSSIWDEVPGEAFDALVGRSGTFSLWPPQDIWDTIVGNAAWSLAHERWFQGRLAALHGSAGFSNGRAIADSQWWQEFCRGIHPDEFPSVRNHTPTTWAAWAERGELQLRNAPVIIPVSDMPL